MKRNNYVLITAISFILFMSRGIVGPLGSVYTRSLGASYVAIGALSTVTSLMSVIFAYFWGRASDLVQRRKSFLLLGLAFLALDSLFTSLVPSYIYLFPLRIFDAVAQAAYGVASLALMGDILGKSKAGRGTRMGAYRGFASLGFGLMAFIAGYIVEATSLRVPYRISAVFLLIAFILALQIEESEQGKEAKQFHGLGWFLREVTTATILSVREAVARLTAALRGGAGHAELLADERTAEEREEGPKVQLPLMPLLISSLLWSLVFGAVYALWANYMKEDIGYSERAVSQLWSLASSLEFPMMILAGWLSDRIGRLPMLSLGFVAWALVFIGYVFIPGMPWIIGIQVLRSFAFSAFTATAMIYAAEVRGKAQRGQVSGLYSSAGGIGSILGATVGGTITQLAGFRTMIGSMAAVIVGGALYLAKEAWQHHIRARRAQAS